MSKRRQTSTVCSKSSNDITAPVGLCGELIHIKRVRLSTEAGNSSGPKHTITTQRYCNRLSTSKKCPDNRLDNPDLETPPPDHQHRDQSQTEADETPLLWHRRRQNIADQGQEKTEKSSRNILRNRLSKFRAPRYGWIATICWNRSRKALSDKRPGRIRGDLNTKIIKRLSGFNRCSLFGLKEPAGDRLGGDRAQG